MNWIGALACVVVLLDCVEKATGLQPTEFPRWLYWVGAIAVAYQARDQLLYWRRI